MMETPVWKCHKCGRPVALMDGEPFTWWEPHYKTGEISPAYAVCETWPGCESGEEDDNGLRN